MSDEDVMIDCNFCKAAEELEEEAIPLWSKKNENYSPYPKMITCNPNYSLKNDDLKEKEPKLNENSLECKLTFKDHTGKFVFYWAPEEQENIHTIVAAESAYGSYENHGLKKIKGDGSVAKVYQQIV